MFKSNKPLCLKPFNYNLFKESIFPFILINQCLPLFIARFKWLKDWITVDLMQKEIFDLYEQQQEKLLKTKPIIAHNGSKLNISTSGRHTRWPARAAVQPRCTCVVCTSAELADRLALLGQGYSHDRLSAETDQSVNHPPRSPEVYLGTSKQQMEEKAMFKAPLRARCASLTIHSSAPHANWAFLLMALCASPDESEHSEIGGAHDGQHSTPADRRSRLTFCPLLQQSQQWPGLVVWLGTHQIRHANRRSTCTATGALGEHDPFPRANGPRAPLARRFDHLIQFTVVWKALFASRLQHCWLGRTMYKRAI